MFYCIVFICQVNGESAAKSTLWEPVAVAAHQCGWPTTVAVPAQSGWLWVRGWGPTQKQRCRILKAGWMLALGQRPYQRVCMQPLERRRDDGTGKLYVDIAVDADADADALGGVGARKQTR